MKRSRPARPRSLARPRLPVRLPRAIRDTEIDQRAARGAARPAPQQRAQEIPALPPATPKVAPSNTVATAAAGNQLRLRGAFWEVSFDGSNGVVQDCRGLRYIALVLRDAHLHKEPIHAKELAALATGQTPEATELDTDQTVLDAVARQQLTARLEELVLERDRACAAEDFDRAERLDDEFERIADELKQAAAPGKRRGGRFNHTGEKARKAVSKAIVEAIARINTHPGLVALAEHLTSTIRRGQWLSYTGSSDWHIDFRPPVSRK